MATSSLPTPQALDELSNPDAEIAGLASKIPALYKFPQGDPETVIKRVREVYNKSVVPPPIPEVKEEISSYTTRDGTGLRLLVFRPAGETAEPLPLFVWYHGGGGCLGTPEQSSALCRTIVQDHKCIVIAVQYRLAPEFRSPHQINDSWDALQYIAAHASSYRADPNLGFIIGGESAGAVIAAPLAILARDTKLIPSLTGVFLTAGSYFNPSALPEEYKDLYRSRYDERCLSAPLLSKEAKHAFDACMQGDYKNPLFKAAVEPTGHKGLPKTYLQTCGMDINRDEGILYEDLLRKAGVETRLDVYPGAPHCFWHLFPASAQGKKWKEDTRAGLGWLFEGK